MVTIEDTQPNQSIEIEAMRIVDEVSWENISDAHITVSGDIADRLRNGLRGSVIESDLQSLFSSKDGVNLLTGSAPLSDAINALSLAGLPSPLLDVVNNWQADAVSVHFVDARL